MLYKFSVNFAIIFRIGKKLTSNNNLSEFYPVATACFTAPIKNNLQKVSKIFGSSEKSHYLCTRKRGKRPAGTQGSARSQKIMLKNVKDLADSENSPNFAKSFGKNGRLPKKREH